MPDAVNPALQAGDLRWREPAAQRIAKLAAPLEAVATAFATPPPARYDSEAIQRHEAIVLRAGAVLDELDDAQRHAVCTALHPQLGSAMARLWVDAQSHPYQGGHSMFRDPTNPVATRWRRAQALKALIDALGPVDDGTVWLATNCAGFERALGGGGTDGVLAGAIGPLLAAAIDMGGESGDAVLAELTSIASAGAAAGAMSQCAVVALLMCARTEAWEAVERLLLAARRQEGLRLTILEAAPQAHPDAFGRLIDIVASEDLTRFASVVTAVRGWLGRPTDVTDLPTVRRHVAQLAALLRDGRLVEETVRTGGPWDAYVALCAVAVRDVAATEPLIASLLSKSEPDSRATGLQFASASWRRQGEYAACIDDPDLGVAMVAYTCVGVGRVAEGFEQLERLVRRLPASPRSIPGLGVDPNPIVMSRSSVVRDLVSHSRDEPMRVLPWVADGDPWTRVSFIDHVGSRFKRTGDFEPKLRAVVLDMVGDRSPQVRSRARGTIFASGVTPADALELESLLTRKTSELRRGVVLLLLSLPEEELLASATRLWNGKAAQRDAACDLLAGAPLRTPAVEAMAAAFAADRPSPRQRETLSSVTAAWVDLWMNDPHLGLYDPSRRASITQPAPESERAPLTTDTSWRIVAALDEFFVAHRDTPVVFRHSPSALLADLHSLSPEYRFELDGSPLDGRSADDVLDSWWGDRPDDLREFGDDLDALRAMVALAATPTGFTAEDWPQQNDWRHPWGHKWWTTLVSDRLGDVGEGVRVRTMLGSVLRDRVMTHPSAAVIDECLTGLTDVLAAVPPERFAQLPRAEERYVIRPGGDEWRGLFDLLVWEVVLSGLFRSSPDTFTPEQVGTWWRLRRLIDEPYPGVRRDRVPDALTLRAHVAGEATDDDAYDMLFKPGYQLFSSWTRRQRDLLAQQYPAAVLLADRMRERAVELERTRGDLRTHATELAARVQYIEGVSIVVDLLDRFGPGALVRGYADPASRNGSLSHLIRVCHPAAEDTGGRLKVAAADAGLSSDRLVELAMYAPQWAELVEVAISWKGLAEVVWWYHAHTKDRRWYVGREIQESWAAAISERTRLSGDDLLDGAVDVDWFHTAHRRLGAERWQSVHELTALASRGTGYMRAKGFAEAMLGRADEVALLERIRAKRHQDSVRSIGLLPLPKAAKKRDATVLERYGVIREFERGSRKFGSQRRESEGTAARIGLENLARTAGHTDTQRFSWAMEAAEAGALADGPITVVEGDVTVLLSVDHEGTPAIDVSRAGKTLAAVPAKLRKVPAIAELTDRRTKLTRQASRVRHSLEASMIAGERFDPADLEVLDRHPVVAPMLEQLLFADDAGRVVRRRRGGEFEVVDGATVPANSSLRLAHPVDLVTDDWSAWQATLFDDATRQPFRQAFRELYVPTASERTSQHSGRWVGQQVQPQQARALLASRGWLTRHEEETSLRVFHGHDIAAWVDIAGWGELGSVELPTVGSLSFSHLTEHKQLLLDQVPAVVFSEAMRDLDLVVSVAHAGGVDPESSASTVEVRAAVVRESARLMGLDNVRFVGEQHAVIDGTLGEYSVHLGSGTVHRRPGGSIVLIPADAQRRGRLFLPFLDDDPVTAFVLSAVVLLARDDEIQDPTILAQLRS